MLATAARYEWALMLLIPMGLLLWELRSLRKTDKAAEERAVSRATDPPPR